MVGAPYRVARMDFSLVSRRAIFYLSRVEIALADAEAHGHADHFVLGELEAGAFGIVVVNFDPEMPLARSWAA
jgi:hypothetical protein